MTSPATPPPSGPSSSPGNPQRLAIGIAGVVVIALIVVVIFAFAGHHTSKHAGESTQGIPLPKVEMKRFDATGSPVQLADLAKGMPMVVNVWSSTCEPCQRETPAIESVHRQSANKVVFVGVNVSDTAEDGEAFIHKYGATYDQVRDPRAALLTSLRDAALLPTTLIVNSHRKVVDSHTGAVTASQLRGMLHDDLGITVHT